MLSILLLIAAGAAAWFAYTKIQDQLAANKPVSVPPVAGIQEQLAVKKITDAGLVPSVHREASADAPKDQSSARAPIPEQKFKSTRLSR